MGVWGAGLYSGDFASDLRAAIGAVARLPFDADKLLDIVCETEPDVAKSPEDGDHTTFWLVVADQFAKRGISSKRAREAALRIIDTGEDLAMQVKLGMAASNLERRRKILQDVRARVIGTVERKRTGVLQKRQPLLMDAGDVLVYPVCGGDSINPYRRDGMPGWKQDGWSACVIVDRGRAFDFLAWYRPLTIAMALADKPAVLTLRGELLWKLERAGTCSAVHFKRIQFEKIGTVVIDEPKLKRAFPEMRPGTSAAVNDISIANGLAVGPHIPAELMPHPGERSNSSRGRTFPTLLGIEQILREVPASHEGREEGDA